MIDDLSRTLQAILEDELPILFHFPVQIVFDRPDDKFNPAQATVDLFLYDIHENTELRSNEPRLERKDGKVIIYRPPLRVECSYLITVWPVSGQDLPLQEHRLLSQTLYVLTKYPTIPERFLQGSLMGQKPPLAMIIAHAENFKNPAEFWTAIGNKMRPSITLTVTISLETFLPENAPIVMTQEIKLGQRTSPEEEKISPATQELYFHIGGLITDNTNSAISNATVILFELDIKATSDENGRYHMGPINSGTYTLHVQSDAKAQDFKISIPASAGSDYDLKLE